MRALAAATTLVARLKTGSFFRLPVPTAQSNSTTETGLKDLPTAVLELLLLNLLENLKWVCLAHLLLKVVFIYITPLRLQNRAGTTGGAVYVSPSVAAR